MFRWGFAGRNHQNPIFRPAHSNSKEKNMYKIGTIKKTELSKQLAYEAIEWMNANNQKYNNPPVNHWGFDDEVYSYNREKKEN